ncbi:phosphatidylglycerophosphatase A [Pseudaminobacter sp. 19-2017]|uniref:Phosphatidylglycerophosphatase A n=1 Tax=Pseudaminobacter soli (ex Zhang et al. 2022) TaxID=2831468 RepID=A0A942I241_9HYPH|nr:phosphatidylglycerophosphatase A [Pseudaminobacter soli]MBS3649022.1 phosphatidylglycerophosphatase A [Pseudaminobacter soli]
MSEDSASKTALRIAQGSPPERIAFWIAVSGGAGLSPLWPGTVGSALGVGLAACLVPAGQIAASVVLALVFVLGVWSSSVIESESGKDDPQFVVIDETFGAAATLVLLPVDPVWWIAGFLFFRIFDVLKPWPANLVHRRMRGGLAIMLDDAIAVAYAVALLLSAAALFGFVT